MRYGIDVSNWQPTVLATIAARYFPQVGNFKVASALSTATDWNRIKLSGSSFAIIKASEGVTYKDPAFPIHYEKAKAAGLKIGTYHFLIRSTAAPILGQVDNFIAAIGDRDIDIPHILDVESHPYYGNVTANDVFNFLTILTQKIGRRPIIYTSQGYWSYLGNPMWGADLADLWVAAYRSYFPPQIPPWSGWKMWQFMSTAKIAGMTGNVDLNMSNVDW